MNANKRRRFQSDYAPGSDGTLELWIDPSDSSKLTKLGGGSISNGDHIGTWATSGGAVARTFIQWASFQTPTWETNAINGLSAMRSQNQIIVTQDSLTRWDAISGLTYMHVNKTVGTNGVVTQWSCADASPGSFANITHFGAGGDVPDVSGWRRPNVDTFQDFHVSPAQTNHVSVFTMVMDFTNATVSLFDGGVQTQYQKQPFGSTGVTDGRMFAMCFGAFAQETGSTAFGFTPDGYKGECLVWLSAKTPQQLVAPHYYLRRKWGGGLL